MESAQQSWVDWVGLILMHLGKVWDNVTRIEQSSFQGIICLEEEDVICVPNRLT